MLSFDLPLKLSLCIFLPSVAIAAYFVHKSIESKDGDTDDSLKSKQSFIEVKVPGDCVGNIIGSGGAVIKELQRKTNTRINFRDSLPLDGSPNAPTQNGRRDDAAPGEAKNKSDRLLVIRGNYLNVLRAEIEIRRLIVDSTSKLTEYFYVPYEACGRIIGRRGATIKEISTLSNCVIKLNDDLVDANDSNVKKNSLGVEKTNSKADLTKSSDNLSQDDPEFELASKLKLKKVAITGSFEQIEQAKELITNKIKEEFQFKERAFSRRNKENYH